MAFQSDRVSFLQTRSRVWRSGPVQSEPANRVRAGRQQLSTGPPMCRRSPDRHTGERVVSRPKPDPTSGDGSPSRSVGSPRCPTSRSTPRLGTSQRRHRRPTRSRIPLLWAPRYRQDLNRSHLVQGPQLREPSRGRTLLRMRLLPFNRCRHKFRCARTRRRL